MNTRLYTPESHALAAICNEWYITFGSLTLIVVASLYVSPLWMPLIELVLAVLLALFGPSHKLTLERPCGRLNRIAIYTLILTGLISFGINVAYKTEFVHHFFDIETLNTSIPYISSLVVFPICTFITAFELLPVVRQRHIQHCYLHNGYNPRHPMLGRIVHATYKSLEFKLLYICLFISIVDWCYYFLCYNNSSINRSDSFFFFVIPATIYVWSIVYVRHSYSTLTLSNGRIVQAVNAEPTEGTMAVTDSAIVRFLVVHHDCLLLDVSETAMTECAVDTPLIEIKTHSYEGDTEIAKNDFEHRTGISDFTIKKLYASEYPIHRNKVYHFLVDISPKANVDILPGTWMPLNAIDSMMKSGLLAPALSDEIFRVYTIAMAWKTFDSHGRRRYPIRNYRPTFRLEDIHKWDVDYEDSQWLRVAKHNQDSPFWFIKKFFWSPANRQPK